ncbi:hypothetical protein LCGC14_2693320 [marine sediment metagenome]|uniref:Uncharacterized protein n=1 Tax=marine sediment metagenome TaxID=412755 RepID=A0A0F9A5E8_9ZZZZ
MKDSQTVATLIGGLLGLAFLWITFAPMAVIRAEMQDYVDVTATEHLRILRGDIGVMNQTLVRVRERLAGVEAILRERDNG